MKTMVETCLIYANLYYELEANIMKVQLKNIQLLIDVQLLR